MTIYESEQVRPYVYMGTHKITGQFYIGYREVNKIPSHLDIYQYQTSSEEIAELGFDNFDWIIIAEFFGHCAGYDAFDLENDLIKENFNDPLNLNGQYWDWESGKKRFKPSLAKGRPVSLETRIKISEKAIGRKSPRKGKTHTEASKKKKMSNSRLGMKLSESHRMALSVARTGEKNSMYGKSRKGEKHLFSDQGMQNVQMANSYPVMCYGIEYPSVKAAQDVLPGISIRKRLDNPKHPEFIRLREKISRTRKS